MINSEIPPQGKRSRRGWGCALISLHTRYEFTTVTVEHEYITGTVELLDRTQIIVFIIPISS